MSLNTTPAPWIIATRESRLALWQAHHVQALLTQQLGARVDLMGMTTQGDQILDRSLSKIGGKGLFVKELEHALWTGQAHLAVHSLKDVPMELPEGFILASVLEREDPRDAWVSTQYPDLLSLPPNAKVGTSSLRRLVQLRAQRPDVVIVPLRGNLDTRLRKLDEGHYDAIVLAAAGLKRLGLSDRIRSFLALDTMIPAAGQGALALEIHQQHSEWALPLLSGLTHPPTWLAVHAERAVSRTLGGSCSMPLAAHARWLDAQTLHISTALGATPQETSTTDAPTDTTLIKVERTAVVQDIAAAEALGHEAAQQLLASGGQRLLPSLHAINTAP